jgi:hypothetical protein
MRSPGLGCLGGYCLAKPYDIFEMSSQLPNNFRIHDDDRHQNKNGVPKNPITKHQTQIMNN